MADLKTLLSDYIKQAGQATQSKDYSKALDCVLHARECALQLAKQSYAKQQKDYLSNAESLKEIAQTLTLKIKLDLPSGPASPKREEPKQETPDSPRDIRGSLGGLPDFLRPDYRPDSSNSAYPSLDRLSGDPVPSSAPAAKPADPVPVPADPVRQPQQNDSTSPQYLDDYIGQPQAIKAVKDLIGAALLKNSALPHLIVYGSHGLGKTTFAHIIANEMKANFVEVNVSKITVPDMVSILKKIKPRDVIFIDEIHTLPLPVAESVLYSAMQDGKVTYTEGKGGDAHTEVLTLPPFTLIGATTEIGKLAKPFIQRAIQIRLQEYSDEVLGNIVTAAFHKLGMVISEENGLYIAKRCRNNPRVANVTVKRITDKAIVRYAAENNVRAAGSFDSVEAIRRHGIEVTLPVIDEFFQENGIDEFGLERGDREFLHLIIDRFNGGPVGIDTLARAMNESNNVLTEKYESYLIKKGMIKIEREGRVAMPEAYRALGLPVPKGLEEKMRAEEPKGASGPAPEPPASPAPEPVPAPAPEPEHARKENSPERKTVLANSVPDELKCSKIEKLITYPENVKIVGQSLDELFPDVVRPMESECNHVSEIEADFGQFKRTLVCDSNLESKFAMGLLMVGYVQDIKSQTVEIPYISQELATRRYFPDFVILDYRGRVSIIEMKNFDMVSYHLNIDKYDALKQFCVRNGYGYAEVMKANGAEEYTTVEELASAPVNAHLEQYIKDTIARKTTAAEKGCFTNDDLSVYIAQNGPVDRAEVYTILLNNRRLKNIDRSGNGFKIVDN